MYVVNYPDGTHQSFKTCLLPIITPETEFYMSCYEFYAKNIMLNAGGMNDQPNNYLTAMRVIDSAVKEHERKQMEKQNVRQ